MVNKDENKSRFALLLVRLLIQLIQTVSDHQWLFC